MLEYIGRNHKVQVLITGRVVYVQIWLSIEKGVGELKLFFQIGRIDGGTGQSDSSES